MKLTINPTQLLLVAHKLKCSEEMTRALRYYFIDGDNYYSAETKSGVYRGSLRKKVARVKEELEFVAMFNKAHTEEQQQALDI